MKSVTFSDIQHIQERARRLPAALPAPRLAALALTLALGLGALATVVHLGAPATPLGYIVLPLLLGGLLPLARVLPGRLEVSTRFSACHLVGTLDEEMDRLGYVPTERGPGTVRYRTRGARWPRRRAAEVTVAVHEHALEVTGPMPALRALRARMDA
ncbi:hypothetical protein [uncultured Massilia sp.]|uniref:hypothetical protein n=1 Tax=uncultured Massilia sp. TaxID=169973 RepID=UPI0025EFBC77|nr:hypothetical protein [uncultured Massilia sp.]